MIFYPILVVGIYELFDGRACLDKFIFFLSFKKLCRPLRPGSQLNLILFLTLHIKQKSA